MNTDSFEKNQNMRLRRGRKLPVAAATAALAILAASTLGGASAAFAAPGAVANLGVSVSFDGTPGFDSDDLAGHDSGPNNGIVRSNDQVEYLLASTFSAIGEVQYVSTLPAGMEWDSTSVAATVCNGPGGGLLSGSNRTWTCNRTAEQSVESFKVRAWVTSAGHGSVVAPTFAVSTVTSTAPGVTVSATPKTEMRNYRNTTNLPSPLHGVDGVLQNIGLSIGAMLPSSGSFKGYEALAESYSMRTSVPANAVPVSAVIAYGGGSVTLSQPAGPGTPVTITVTNSRTDFLNAIASAGHPADFRKIGEIRIEIWTPFNPTVPANVPTVLGGQIVDFDPLSASGQSNFGSGFAPGFESGATCMALSPLSGTSCWGESILRRDDAVIRASTVGAMATLSNTYIYGDGHGYTNGDETVLPGQSFLSLTAVRNDPTAGAPGTNAFGLLAWDPKQMQLRGAPEAWLNSTRGSPDSFYVVLGNRVPQPEFSLRYTDHPFANDAERKNFDPDTLTWVEDPSTLAGGIGAVSAVWFTYLTPLQPNTAVGITTPLVRPLSTESLGQPANTRLPWYWQYGSDEQSRVPSTYVNGITASSTGGSVAAAEALIRSTAKWESASAMPGSVQQLVVTPAVIGPVGANAPTTAKNSRISIKLDSVCSEPVWSVVTGMPGYLSHTPGDAGADGIPCTADDGAPASIVFDLGDLDAPSGAAGPAPYQGHATGQTPLRIPVNISPLAPSGSIQTATIVASSDSDKTRESFEGITNQSPTAKQQDRTEFAAITVQGVASFSGSKTASTREGGVVAPNEEFTYTINWGNGTSDLVGAGTFVDLLPYNGDSRGTLGLPENGLRVADVAASTANAAVMGDVEIEFSTDASEDIAAALLLPDNSDGRVGITWETGEVPANATALRFITEKPLDPGFTGSATISMTLSGLAIGGQLKNDFHGRTAAVGGDDNTIKRIVGASEVALQSTGGSLAGSVWRDLDFSNSFTDEDAVWPVGSKVLTLTSAFDTFTTDIGADGSFDLGVIPAGEYVASVSDSTGWVLILPNPLTVSIGQVLSDSRILFQEQLETTTLMADNGNVYIGESVDIDVKLNDEWHTAAAPAPQTAASIQPGGEATFGTATITPEGILTYTASADWPEQFAGQATYEDVMTYTVTDSAGVTATATVTVTVKAPRDAPVANNDEATVPWIRSTDVNTLGNDVGDDLSIVTARSLDESDNAGLIEIVDGKIRFTPSQSREWAEGELNYVEIVEYTINDSHGGEATATLTLTVVRPPVGKDLHFDLTNDAGRIIFDPMGEATGTDLQGLTSNSIVTPPIYGKATVTDGVLTYTPKAGYEGDDTFTIRILDAFGQYDEVTYTFTITAGEDSTPAPTDPGVSETPPSGSDGVLPGGNTGLAVTGIDQSFVGFVAFLLLICGAMTLIIRRQIGSRRNR